MTLEEHTTFFEALYILEPFNFVPKSKKTCKKIRETLSSGAVLAAQKSINLLKKANEVFTGNFPMFSEHLIKKVFGELLQFLRSLFIVDRMTFRIPLIFCHLLSFRC